jgi:hypothetical protein
MTTLTICKDNSISTDQYLPGFTGYRPAMVMTQDEEKGFLVSVQIASTGLSGFDLLENVLESLGRFIQESGVLVHIALDVRNYGTSLTRLNKYNNGMSK